MIRRMMIQGLNNGLKIPNFGGTTVLWFGDSMTFGYDIDPAFRFSTIVSTEYNGVEDNRGVTGATLIASVCVDHDWFKIADVPTKTTSISKIYLAYGGNDALLKASAATFKTSLTSAVNGIIAKGYAATDIIIIDGYYLTELDNYIGECGVTSAQTRAGFELFVTASQEVAAEKGTVLAKVYDFTKNLPTRGYVDGLHFDVPTHREVSNFLQQLDYVAYVPPVTSTLLTGATRYAPAGTTSLGSNKYQKSGTGDVSLDLGKSLTGLGFIASQYKADAGFGHYIGANDGSFAGFYIENNGTISWELGESSSGNIAAPAVDEFMIFGRFSGNVIQLKYGTTLENAVVKKDFGTNTSMYALFANSIPSTTRIYIYHPQGIGLT